VRAVLESWAADYPAHEQVGLAARLGAEFEATFFEMFLFQVFRGLGSEVEPHPLLTSGATARPDFLARFPTSQALIVEARVATDRSDAERRESARSGVLFDEIEKIESPNFFLSIDDVSNASGRQPSGRRIRAFIERHIAGLDPDEVAERLAAYGPDAVPSWTLEEDGFEFTFSVVPKSPNARGKGGPSASTPASRDGEEVAKPFETPSCERWASTVL
jgi:hypothetical protein